MRLPLFFALLTPLVVSAQVPAPSSARPATLSDLPSVSAILPAGVQPGVGFLAAWTGKGMESRLSPRVPGMGKKKGIESSASSGTASTLRIELLAFLPSPPGTLPSTSTFYGLVLAAASPRSLAGLQYWSASRKRVRTLYSKAYRVDSMEKKSPLSDPGSLGELGGGPPWRTYVWLEDLTFGGNLYAFDISIDGPGLSLEITNMETVLYFLFPVAKPGAMKERIEVFACLEGILVWVASTLEAPGFGSARVFESAGNKGLAVLRWYAGRAASLGLASPA